MLCCCLSLATELIIHRSLTLPSGLCFAGILDRTGPLTFYVTAFSGLLPPRMETKLEVYLAFQEFI